MWYLSAAVVFVGALCVVDLILSLGIIRRLREHDAQLRHQPTNNAGMTTVAAGTRVVGLPATTVRREQPDEAQRLFAFVSPGCGACEDQLPAFIRYVAGEPRHAVTVVIHTAGEPDDGDADDDAEPYVARLAGVAEVVVEPREGPLGKAFQVAGYPTWVLIDPAGIVLASGVAIDRIAASLARRAEPGPAALVGPA